MPRILGIDPGSRVTGYGVIDSDGRSSRYVSSGCIRTTSSDFCSRLGDIYRGIQAVVEQEQPNEVAIESVFMGKNAASALKLGQARGAAICAAVVAGMEVAEYSPRAIKQALVGSGAAEKEQVQHMIRLLLGIRKKMGLDESDALAIAICHAHSRTSLSRIGSIR